MRRDSKILKVLAAVDIIEAPAMEEPILKVDQVSIIKGEMVMEGEIVIVTTEVQEIDIQITTTSQEIEQGQLEDLAEE